MKTQIMCINEAICDVRDVIRIQSGFSGYYLIYDDIY